MLLKKSDLVHSRAHLPQVLTAQNNRSKRRAHERGVAAEDSATKMPSSGPMVHERTQIEVQMKGVKVTAACRNHLVEQLALSKAGEYKVVSGGFNSGSLQIRCSHEHREANSKSLWTPPCRTRTITFQQIGDMWFMACSCLHFYGFGLPCRHLLFLTNGMFGPADIPIQKLLDFYNGSLDAIISASPSGWMLPDGPGMQVLDEYNPDKWRVDAALVEDADAPDIEYGGASLNVVPPASDAEADNQSAGSSAKADYAKLQDQLREQCAVYNMVSEDIPKRTAFLASLRAHTASWVADLTGRAVQLAGGGDFVNPGNPSTSRASSSRTKSSYEVRSKRPAPGNNLDPSRAKRSGNHTHSSASSSSFSSCPSAPLSSAPVSNRSGGGDGSSSGAHNVSSDPQVNACSGGDNGGDGGDAHGRQPPNVSNFADPVQQRGPGRPKQTSDEELSGVIVKALLGARRIIIRPTDVDMQGSPQWVNFKRGKISGTVASAVRVGGDGLLAAVAKMFQLNDEFQPAPVSRGLLIEQRVIQTFVGAPLDGFTVCDSQAIYVHDTFSWIVYSPDAVIANGSERVLVEVQSFTKLPIVKISTQVNDQVQLGMWVMGLHKAMVLVCQNDDAKTPIVLGDLQQIHVHADLAWQANFEARAAEVYADYLSWFHTDNADIEKGCQLMAVLISKSKVGKKKLAALKKYKEWKL